MYGARCVFQSCTSRYNPGTWGIVQGQLRPLLAPRVYMLPMVRSIGKTMVQGKNYGPQITVKRISTRSVTYPDLILLCWGNFMEFSRQKGYSWVWQHLVKRVSVVRFGEFSTAVYLFMAIGHLVARGYLCWGLGHLAARGYLVMDL